MKCVYLRELLVPFSRQLRNDMEEWLCVVAIAADRSEKQGLQRSNSYPGMWDLFNAIQFYALTRVFILYLS